MRSLIRLTCPRLTAKVSFRKCSPVQRRISGRLIVRAGLCFPVCPALRVVKFTVPS